jgi:hypothetical protein
VSSGLITPPELSPATRLEVLLMFSRKRDPNKVSSWEDMIEIARDKIEGLEAAIKLFEGNRDKGLPFE